MPFAGYEDFAECVSKNSDKKNPQAYCGTVKKKVEGAVRVSGNLIFGGIKLVPLTGTDQIKPEILGQAKGELLKFEKATLARAERNRNCDELSENDILALAASIAGMPITDEHAERQIVGYILAGYAENMMLLIDGILFAGRFPEVTAGVQSGNLKLSIEADADKAICSLCGGVYASQHEYCQHIATIPNRYTYKASRKFQGIVARGAGVVKNPAGSGVGFDTNRLSMVASNDYIDGVQADYGEMCDPVDVNYRKSQNPAVACETCKYFREFTKTCDLVAGFISAGALCDLYESSEGYSMAEAEKFAAALESFGTRIATLETQLTAAFPPKKDDEADDKKAKKDDKDMKADWAGIKAELEKLSAAFAQLKAENVGGDLPGTTALPAKDLPMPSPEPGGTDGHKEAKVGVGEPTGFQAAQKLIERLSFMIAQRGEEYTKANATVIASMSDAQFDLVKSSLTASKPQSTRSTPVTASGVAGMAALSGLMEEASNLDVLAPFYGGSIGGKR